MHYSLTTQKDCLTDSQHCIPYIAREASKRIVDDLLLSAGVRRGGADGNIEEDDDDDDEGNTDDYTSMMGKIRIGGRSGLGDEDEEDDDDMTVSPSVVRRGPAIEDESLF